MRTVRLRTLRGAAVVALVATGVGLLARLVGRTVAEFLDDVKGWGDAGFPRYESEATRTPASSRIDARSPRSGTG